MDDLILYLQTIREGLENQSNKTIPVQLIMDEICEMATSNWVETGTPNLTQQQIDKAVMLGLSKNIILN